MKNRVLLISLVVMLALSMGLVACGGEQVQEYSLTISSTEGGKVTAPGEGVFVCDEGMVIDLAAEADEGYKFVNWTGLVGTIANVNDAITTIAMNDYYSVTANFVKQYSLTISSSAGGSVTMPGEGTHSCDEGTVVSLVAEPDEGYHFADWTGNVSTIANVNATVTSITMSTNYTITANFAPDPYFWASVHVILSGPATLPPGGQDSCVFLEVFTNNIAVNSVRVDFPDGRSVMVPRHTDVFTPGVDWTTLLRFSACEPGMTIAGGEYVFTALDAAGQPIPSVGDADVWVGVEPPNSPTNVRAEVTQDGILVSWDESPIVPGSFEPAAEPQLGWYQLNLHTIEPWVTVYGADIAGSPHLIPRDKANLTGYDRGLSLDELEDGTYRLDVGALSVAPEGSLGQGMEYHCFDTGQTVVFTIQDGEVTIE